MYTTNILSESEIFVTSKIVAGLIFCGLILALVPCNGESFTTVDNGVYKCKIKYSGLYYYNNPSSPTGASCVKIKTSANAYIILGNEDSSYNIVYVDKSVPAASSVIGIPLDYIDSFVCRPGKPELILASGYSSEQTNVLKTLDIINNGSGDAIRWETLCLRGPVKEVSFPSALNTVSVATKLAGTWNRVTCYINKVYTEGAFGAKDWDYVARGGAVSTGTNTQGFACIDGSIKGTLDKKFTDQWYASDADGDAQVIPLGIVDDAFGDTNALRLYNPDMTVALIQTVDTPQEPWLP